jgi:hypothetical protein
MGDTVRLALPLSSASESSAVIDAITRDYPCISASYCEGELVLASTVHDDAWLTAIGWCAAASLAQALPASELRADLMDYLLS